jgi:hypothetical protein
MSIPGLLLAGVLAATAAQAQPAVSSAQDAPARLEDIEVTGRSLDSLVRRFVDEVAAPNPRRNLARWNGPV